MARYAIVGASCLFPGASSVEEFWRNLVAGTDSRADGGAEIFGAPTAAEGGDRHRIYCTKGGFVRDFSFDASGYLVPPATLGALDRVFQWSLHVAREALLDAGRAHEPATLRRTGIVLGNYSFPTKLSTELALPLWHDAVLAGLREGGVAGGATARGREPPAPENLFVGGLPPRVIGAALGLGGPQFAIDAACSSALYSLKLACDYLDSGRADLMLAGAVCAPDPLLIHLSFSDLHAYPQDGDNQPFDKRSQGIITGQGAGMFALRRVADALRDGDRIYAVVEGVGLANDGAGNHILSPSVDGQVGTYELAYAASGVDPADVAYVECHATGTPLGDRTELESLARFFGARGVSPLLGSVKANVGHVLTVAGMSSMLKVILSMRRGVIPPTIGVAEPLASADGAIGGGRVVSGAREWPAQPVRRAGVSAFGFGGTNAHVVMREPAAAADPEATAANDHEPSPPPRLEVVGMGAQLGGLDGLDAFERATFESRPVVRALPRERWRGFETASQGELPEAGLAEAPEGAFAASIEIDPVSYRIPPTELRHFNRQHLLMLKAADEALRDAGYERPDGPGLKFPAPQPRRIAVIVAMEMEAAAHGHRARYDLGRFVREQIERAGTTLSPRELAAIERAAKDAIHDTIEPNEVLSYIGSVVASRISSLWNLTGPSFTLSADSAAGACALDAASLLLHDPTVEAVLVGGVDMAGNAETVLARARRAEVAADGSRGLSFGAEVAGWRPGDGAAAVVVTRAGAAQRRAYAHIDAIAIRHASAQRALMHSADSAGVEEAAHEALSAAGITAADVEYLEASANGVPSEDDAEVAGLSRAYRGDDAELRRCALGSAKALIGDAHSPDTLAAVIRAALALHRGYVPGAAGWTEPKPGHVDALERSSFYVPTETRPWLRASRDARRRAAVSAVGFGGTQAHLVLSGEAVLGDERAVDWRRAGGHLIVPVAADTRDALLEGVAAVRDRIAAGHDPWSLAGAALQAIGQRRLRAIFVAPTAEAILRELELGLKHLRAVCDDGGEWSTPTGSYFTANPIGSGGKVAFVFPGAFNSYIGLGADLFRCFPALLPRFEEQCAGPARMFRDRLLYPRTLRALGRRDLMHRETALLDDIPSMLATGTSFALLYVEMLREILALQPHGAFGYSLGESSMMFAMRGWEETARDDAKISRTALFKDRLCGPKRTVRELWGLGAEVPDAKVWASHILLTDADSARAAVERYDRVFLTHVNTASEVVIAGAPEQCRALIDELGCRSARSPVNHVMHCPVVDPELDELADLNSYPTRPVADAALYSAFDYRPVESFERGVVARRIAHTLRSTVDFARLVRAGYDDGFRYFVEVGPNATCTRWIRETLAGRDHVAMPVDRRGASTPLAVAQLIARLASHGVPLDLGVLIDSGAVGGAPARPTRTTIPAGGDPIPALVRAGVAAAVDTRAGDGTTDDARRAASGDGSHDDGVDEQSQAPPAAGATGEGASAGEEIGSGGQPLAVAAVDFDAERSAVAAGDAVEFDGEPLAVVAGDAVEFDGEPFAVVAGDAVEFDGEPFAVLAGDANGESLAVVAGGANAESSAVVAGGANAEPSAVVAGAGREATELAAAAHPGEEPVRGHGEPTARLDAGVAPSAPSAALSELRRQAAAAHAALLDAHTAIDRRRLARLERSVAARPDSRACDRRPGAGPLQVVPALGTRDASLERRTRPDGVVWDERDLLEFATGRVASVFGPRFAAVDGYAKRVRLPAPPYLFVTRVTDLDAEPGRFGRASICTEFDVPDGAWFLVDGQVPPAVTIEAGQCDLLLVSYLGIDFENRGERVYRLLDSSLSFNGDLPRAGQTLRYDITIDRFVRTPGPTLFFFGYKCYADGEPVLELRDACAGFFTQEELEAAGGLVISERERRRRSGLAPATFKPLARTTRRALGRRDLQLLARGRIAEVLGAEYDQEGCNPSLRLPDGRLLMVDEVDDIDRTGGPRRLGRIVATKQLEPGGWYFPCHFPDDPVLAGSLVADGAVQLLQLYALYLGMHLTLPDARFQPVPALRTDVKVRGQITPDCRRLRYEVDVTRLDLLPRPTVVADVVVYRDDQPVISVTNLGIQVREKPGAPYRPQRGGGVPAFLGRRNRLGERALLNELHMAHAAKGDLATAMGPEFEIYRNLRAPYIPNGDFLFVDRVMALEGERGRPRPGATMVTEYDSPPDAWYYRENAFPNVPNCVLMETSLQAAILLGYYLGITLAYPDQEFSIRNLDGKARLVRDLDLRGKTIRQRSRMLSNAALPGAMLQSFTYDLFADGELFYRGESLFGYFTEQALATQVGLDGGRDVPLWLECERVPAGGARRIDLRDRRSRYEDGELRLAHGHLDLVDWVEIVEGGGKHGAGYVRGHRDVRPDEWYFDCHFHGDPVMPGSLGVEAIIQALQLWAIESGVAAGIERPRFALAEGIEMGWKYRGQILRHERDMDFEIHVREVRRDGGRAQVIADASLWKPGLRIYELEGVAIEVRSSA